MISFDTLEKINNKTENRGTFLEYEYFSEINKNKYETLVLPVLHPEEFIDERLASKDEDEFFRKKNLLNKYHEELYRRDTYLNYDQAMELVKECQPFDPEHPSPDFAKRLHAQIKKMFDFGDKATLKFFTAVGSHLDQFHGVDAFFEISGPDGTIAAQTTIDIKKYNPEKEIKADELIVITEKEKALYDSDRVKYQERIDQEAEKIAQRLFTDYKKRLKNNLNIEN